MPYVPEDEVEPDEVEAEPRPGDPDWESFQQGLDDQFVERLRSFPTSEPAWLGEGFDGSSIVISCETYLRLYPNDPLGVADVSATDIPTLAEGDYGWMGVGAIESEYDDEYWLTGRTRSDQEPSSRRVAKQGRVLGAWFADQREAKRLGKDDSTPNGGA